MRGELTAVASARKERMPRELTSFRRAGEDPSFAADTLDDQ